MFGRTETGAMRAWLALTKGKKGLKKYGSLIMSFKSKQGTKIDTHSSLTKCHTLYPLKSIILMKDTFITAMEKKKGRKCG